MNASLILLVALATAAPEAAPPTTYFRPSTVYMDAVRGQSPDLGASDPLSAQTPYIPQGPISPNSTSDPFLSGSGGAEFQGPQGQSFDPLLDPGQAFSTVGPQPYRFGWSTRFDVGYVPKYSTTGGKGDFGWLELNLAAKHSQGWPGQLPNWIFSVTPEFNYRAWEGPALVALPGSVFRFATDFELSTPANNPISLQVGFTPAFVSDLDASVDSEAFNFDGRAVLFLRASPELTVAAGAAYWDRVNDQFIPYAGVIWTPSDRWEFRLLYPKTRISYLLGADNGSALWVYGGFEYNVEAYQIGLLGPDGSNEKIQIADYRAVVGLRSDTGVAAWFAEAGYLFDRQVDFAHGTADFDIGDGWMGRFGLRF